MTCRHCGARRLTELPEASSKFEAAMKRIAELEAQVVALESRIEHHSTHAANEACCDHLFEATGPNTAVQFHRCKKCGEGRFF